MFDPNKKVILRSLGRKSWSNFTRYPKCHDTIVARPSRSGYKTGLSPDLARELEKKMNMSPMTLDHNSSYWKNYAVSITDKDLYLDLSVPQDVIDYHLCLVDPRVANSVSQIYEFPKAEYVLYDEVEDAKNENKHIEIEAEAVAKFNKLTAAQMTDFLKLLGVDASATSPEVTKNRLWKEMKAEPEKFLKLATMKDFETRVLIADLTRNNILRVQGGHYMHGTVDIGFDLQTAVKYLDDPINQDLRLQLMEQLEGALKAK